MQFMVQTLMRTLLLKAISFSLSLSDFKLDTGYLILDLKSGIEHPESNI
jgi:hypothetical protein